MNERIDVLAVMDAEIARSSNLPTAADPYVIERHHAMVDARAAVAELIAKMEQIERLSREADWQLINAGGQPTHLVLGDIARAAIARVGGAPA